MAVQGRVAGPIGVTGALPPTVRLGLGILFCAIIAAAAFWAGERAPLIGAPLFAIAFGVVITNTLRGPLQLSSLRIGEASKLCLKGGIILLGASLNLADIVSAGLVSLPLLVITIAAGLGCAWWIGRLVGVDWRMRCLIGMGTTICGASAIAALAPVVRAKAEEIAYAISVIFFFNMIAVFLFPLLGHLLHLSDFGFGLWTGTAVNDTSAVVAAGFAYSQSAGTTATIVKLTRTTMIIPLVLAFGLALPWLEPRGDRAAPSGSLWQKVYNAVPGFILLFLAAALLNTAGLIGGYAHEVQWVGRAVLVIALAAVGLQGHWRAFLGAGPKPLLLGLVTWAVVAIASLSIQVWNGAI